MTFLSRQYKFVYILDFSPSAANSDIKKNCILLEQKLKALRRSLAGVIRPFTVPGSQVLFTPDIYVTVIAWTPFLCPGAQSVLHQGCLVTPHNLEHFLDVVAKGLNELENRIARIASFVIDELEQNRLQAERIVGDLFEESDDGASEVPNVPMAAPDTGIYIRVGNPNPGSGIRPIFGQFWNPFFNSGFSFLIGRLKLAS